MKPLCACTAPATTSLAGIPMCRECLRGVLDREVADVEELEIKQALPWPPPLETKTDG